jgi:hypothetical protein
MSTPKRNRAWAFVGAVCLLAFAGIALAEVPLDPAALKFKHDRGWLQVTDGVQTARLGIPVSAVKRWSATRDGKAMVVEYELAGACGFAGPEKVTLAMPELWAALENTRGLRWHRQGKFAEAEKGFEKAVAYSPSFKKAVFNLACAQTRQGKSKAALATLAGYVRTEPAETYLHALDDPDLVPLVETPVFQAIKSAKKGDARIKIGQDGLLLAPILYSRDRRLVAATSESVSWGSGAVRVDLVVWNQDSEEKLFSRQLVGWSDFGDDESGKLTAKARRRVGRGLSVVNRFLADLGFTGLDKLKEGAPPSETSERLALRFPSARVGVVVGADKGTIRAVRGNQVLKTFAVTSPVSVLPGGWYAAQEGLLVFTWHIDEPEGCGVFQPIAGAEFLNVKKR